MVVWWIQGQPCWASTAQALYPPLVQIQSAQSCSLCRMQEIRDAKNLSSCQLYKPKL